MRTTLLELDRFSEKNLEDWNRLSADLDEINAVLYSGLEPQRQRHREEMLEALRSVHSAPMDFTGWVRLVTWRYSDVPLSAAGSLKNYGGRFNIGSDVDHAVRAPWPALYIAQDQETAYREAFGLSKDQNVDGLSASELTLGRSYTAVRLNGHIENVFDLAQKGALDGICEVLGKMSLPAEVRRLHKRLRLTGPKPYLIRSASQLLRETLVVNWRALPVQFGIPSVSQILAGLMVDAGYEALRYPSTKGNGECIAVFPHVLASDASFVSLSDDAPPSTTHTRLDLTSAEDLCGWEILPSYQRPGRP